jgi:hypothetical protein
VRDSPSTSQILTKAKETPEEEEEETISLFESQGTHVRDSPSTSQILTKAKETPEEEEETTSLFESQGTHVRDSPSTSQMNDNDKLPCKCFISVKGKRMAVVLTPILGKNEVPNSVSSKINGKIFVMAPLIANNFFPSKQRICQRRKHYVIYLMTEESLVNPIQTFSRPLNSKLLNHMIREESLAFGSDFIYGVHEKNPHTIIHFVVDTAFI